MILSDATIYDVIVNQKVFLVNPFNEEMLQPNSIDLTLGRELKTLHGKCIDLSQGSYKIKPNEFLLGSTEEKINILGVKKETIEKYGVVSKEVAIEMAKLGRKLLNVDICVSVTGNAGPTCEPGGKPAGCFYIGISSKKGSFAKEYLFSQKRNMVRNSAVLAMRDLAHLEII